MLHNMKIYSDNSRRPLHEVEVFVGNILGKTGAQSRKQREDSVSMKQKYEDDAAYFIKLILHDENGYSDDALARSMACFAIALEHRPDTHKERQIVSFKYVAAAVCMKEVARLMS